MVGSPVGEVMDSSEDRLVPFKDLGASINPYTGGSLRRSSRIRDNKKNRSILKNLGSSFRKKYKGDSDFAFSTPKTWGSGSRDFIESYGEPTNAFYLDTGDGDFVACLVEMADGSFLVTRFRHGFGEPTGPYIGSSFEEAYGELQNLIS